MPTSAASLRDRLLAPRAARAAPVVAAGPAAPRALALARALFEVAGAALVAPGPDGLAVGGLSGEAAAAARGVACRLFEALAASAEAAGVLEEVRPGGGFVAAAPVLSEAGRCLGALCLVDAGRRRLLPRLQRRLFAEFGALLAPTLGGAEADRLLRLADAEPDAVAVFDPDGRCRLRNGRFAALLGGASPAPTGGAPAEARGCEAGWLARRLMRERPPVGVYRACLPGGAWLSVEERRGPEGRSLVARVEDEGGPDAPEDRLLFERCPLPMFVFDRDTRLIVAANDAALALYGWERDALLGLGLDGLGPVPGGEEAGPWLHRTRDGRPLALSGRTAELEHRGRPAVLVMVSDAPPGAPA